MSGHDERRTEWMSDMARPAHSGETGSPAPEPYCPGCLCNEPLSTGGEWEGYHFDGVGYRECQRTLTQSENTPTSAPSAPEELAEYLAASEKDDNHFWRLESGDVQNVLDAALEYIDALLQRITELEKALGRIAALEDGYVEDSKEAARVLNLIGDIVQDVLYPAHIEPSSSGGTDTP